jgi:anti-sigma-K factor RskA
MPPPNVIEPDESRIETRAWPHAERRSVGAREDGALLWRLALAAALAVVALAAAGSLLA